MAVTTGDYYINLDFATGILGAEVDSTPKPEVKAVWGVFSYLILLNLTIICGDLGWGCYHFLKNMSTVIWTSSIRFWDEASCERYSPTKNFTVTRSFSNISASKGWLRWIGWNGLTLLLWWIFTPEPSISVGGWQYSMDGSQKNAF